MALQRPATSCCGDSISECKSNCTEISNFKSMHECQFLSQEVSIVLTLQTLPEFNITIVARCLEVNDRLTAFACACSRFYRLVLQPQCFPDMSFFPTDDRRKHQPRILSATGASGITYVEICIHSTHPFVRKVGLLGGMWNFRADLWDKLEWPAKLRIESLQLTLDRHATMEELHLDSPTTSIQQSYYSKHPDPILTPLQKIMLTQTDNQSNKPNNNNIKNNNDDNNRQQNQDQKNLSSQDFYYRIRNLFFIRFDHNDYAHPKIFFPKTLWGLGLQSFNSMTFSQNWWKNQLTIDERFQNIRFLVLSCCEFRNDGELQQLIDSCYFLEHLSLRYVKWKGIIQFPQTLVSLGWFPDAGSQNQYSLENFTKPNSTNHDCKCNCNCNTRSNTRSIQHSTNTSVDISSNFEYSTSRSKSWMSIQSEASATSLLSDDEMDSDTDNDDTISCSCCCCNSSASSTSTFGECKQENKPRLWQVHTRMNENCRSSVQMLNEIKNLQSIKCVKFEYFRQHQPWLCDIELRSAITWEGRNDLTIVIDTCDLATHPEIKRIFPVSDNQFISKDKIDFRDCTNWTNDAQQFIQMTNKRKLLLR